MGERKWVGEAVVKLELHLKKLVPGVHNVLGHVPVVIRTLGEQLDPGGTLHVARPYLCCIWKWAEMSWPLILFLGIMASLKFCY